MLATPPFWGVVVGCDCNGGHGHDDHDGRCDHDDHRHYDCTVMTVVRSRYGDVMSNINNMKYLI